LLYVLVLTYKP